MQVARERVGVAGRSRPGRDVAGMELYLAASSGRAITRAVPRSRSDR